MQNRYAGDIGDYAKYGLLRHLSVGYQLGVAWYLYPDESHNSDGKHIAYLDNPEEWRHLDPELFDQLGDLIRSERRKVSEVETSKILRDCTYSQEMLAFEGSKTERSRMRSRWFTKTLHSLNSCDLVFADPDNGLCEDLTYQHHDRKYWKRIPLSEALVLSAGRTAVIYHHNTMRKGGHIEEIRYWLNQLGHTTLALYWRRGSCRTFFIVNPTQGIKSRAITFAERWWKHCELHETSNDTSSTGIPQTPPSRTDPNQQKQCPECGHRFKGVGWGGIDAHWKAKHLDIMPYEDARPLILNGQTPSEDT